MKLVSRAGVLLGNICFLHCSIYLFLLLLLSFHSAGVTNSLFPNAVAFRSFLELFDNPFIHLIFASVAIVLAISDVHSLSSARLARRDMIIFVLVLGTALLVMGLAIELNGHHCHSFAGAITETHHHDMNHLIAHLIFMAGNILIVIGHRCGAHRLHCPNHS